LFVSILYCSIHFFERGIWSFPSWLHTLICFIYWMEDKVQGLHGNGSSPPSSLFDASFALCVLLHWYRSLTYWHKQDCKVRHSIPLFCGVVIDFKIQLKVWATLWCIFLCATWRIESN